MLMIYIKMFNVIDRQSVIIHHDLNVSVEWYEDLELHFRPDMVKVKEVIYGGDSVPTTREVSGVTTTFLRNKSNLLCSFRNAYTVSNPNTHITIDETTDLLNGSIKFTVVDLAGVVSPTATDGILSFTLEFLRHSKARKENTKYNNHEGQRGGYFDDPSTNVHSTRYIPNPEPVDTVFAPAEKEFVKVEEEAKKKKQKGGLFETITNPANENERRFNAIIAALERRELWEEEVDEGRIAWDTQYIQQRDPALHQRLTAEIESSLAAAQQANDQIINRGEDPNELVSNDGDYNRYTAEEEQKLQDHEIKEQEEEIKFNN